MTNPNYSELVTSTLRARNEEAADNVSNGNALLRMLNMSDRVRTVSGGRVIVEELEYAENATFQYYSGYEVLNINPSDILTAAEFPWKQASVVVSASGLEIDVQNSGPEQVIPLMSKRVENAIRTMRNNISTGVYSDGTGSGGKQVTGLQAIVALDPTTGTVGGIDRSLAANVYWRNQTSGDVAGIDTTSATLLTEMRTMWLECKRGPDVTKLIVADTVLYQRFWESLQDIQRVSDSRRATSGFEELLFVSAPVVYDGDSGIRANTMYFLNTDFIYWRPHVNRNVVPLDNRNSINQDAMVVPIVLAGNLTCSNASLQGVVYT